MTKNNITRFSPDIIDTVLEPVMVKNNIKTEKELDIEE